MEMEMTEVTSPTFQEMAKVLIRVNRPFFLYGSPGSAKSDNNRQLAANLGGVDPRDGKYLGNSRHEYGRVLMLDVRASQWDAVDTRGMPYKADREGNVITSWAQPGFLPTEEESARYDYVIIFLDELNSAAQSVQAALYQLVHDRQLGDYKCPANVRLCAAGNLSTDRAVVNRTSSALADRFFNMKLIPEAASWKRWAIHNDLHIAVISLINMKPDLLYQFDPKSPSLSQATARGWEFVSDALKDCEANGINGEIEAALITSKVGHAAGSELIGFLPIYRQMQNPDAVLMDPDGADISDNVGVNYAMCLALADRVSVDNVDRVIRYAERLRDDERAGAEYMTMLIQRAAKKGGPKVQQTRAYIKWASENDGVLI